MNKILVTGGAGYIGSQMIRQLVETEHEVTVFDNLSGGHKESLEGLKINFVQGDLLNKNSLEEVFQEGKFTAVIHFAGVISMKESTENPFKYFQINTFGALNLFETMVKHQVLKLIFSSSAGVYGNPVKIPILEEDPKNPTNPYGESKLIVEKILSWYDKVYKLRSISLRYFNAAGAGLDGNFGEDHTDETHLIPLACQAALEKDEFTIFGDDYQTKDGTCVRDYVHVVDLCDAHLLALKTLIGGNKTDVFNVGPGIGYSNKEVVAMIKKISGINFPVQYGPRRPGDANELIADSTKIRKQLGWNPQYSDLETIVKTAWEWHQKHPNGYGEDGKAGENV